MCEVWWSHRGAQGDFLWGDGGACARGGPTRVPGVHSGCPIPRAPHRGPHVRYLGSGGPECPITDRDGGGMGVAGDVPCSPRGLCRSCWRIAGTPTPKPGCRPSAPCSAYSAWRPPQSPPRGADAEVRPEVGKLRHGGGGEERGPARRRGRTEGHAPKRAGPSMTPPPAQTTPTSAGPAPPRFLQGGAARRVEEAEVGAELAGPPDPAPPDFPPPVYPKSPPQCFCTPHCPCTPMYPKSPLLLHPQIPIAPCRPPPSPLPKSLPTRNPQISLTPPIPFGFLSGALWGGAPVQEGGTPGGGWGHSSPRVPPSSPPISRSWSNFRHVGSQCR